MGDKYQTFPTEALNHYCEITKNLPLNEMIISRTLAHIAYQLSRIGDLLEKGIAISEEPSPAEIWKAEQDK